MLPVKQAVELDQQCSARGVCTTHCSIAAAATTVAAAAAAVPVVVSVAYTHCTFAHEKKQNQHANLTHKQTTDRCTEAVVWG
jgi:hypothetical protein